MAAASDVGLVVVADAAEVLGAWPTASLVLVGADLAEAVAGLAPARRAGVHLVGHAVGEDAFRAAVLLGAESVVELPDGLPWLGEVLADVDEPSAAARVIGVVGGSGGVGATTLACALGQVAARRGRAVLLDADPLGPGLDRLLGLEDSAGVRWPDLHATTGRLSARALRETVPRAGGPGVVTWAGGERRLDAATVRETLTAATRGHDVVLVDLPRHGDGVTLELARRCDRLLVVCRSSIAGLASAGQVVSALGVADGVASLALRPGRVGESDAAQVTGLPIAAVVPDQPRVVEALDLGLGPLPRRRGALARVAAGLLETAA